MAHLLHSHYIRYVNIMATVAVISVINVIMNCTVPRIIHNKVSGSYLMIETITKMARNVNFLDLC